MDMKNILTALLCVIALPAFSQGSAVSADKMNVFYIGVPNPITIMAEGYNCSVTIPECDGCTFTHTQGCSYDVVVTRAGIVNVKVMVKNGGSAKVAGEHPFRVKYIPDPLATIGGKSRGTMAASLFRVQQGVAVLLENFDFNIKYKVLRYRLTIIRRGEMVCAEDNNGGTFNDAVKKFIQSVRPGDQIIIEEIKAAGPDERVLSLESIDLKII